jgi:hypothetical protein
MPYTPQKPSTAETSDELRARIPGWGADLDPRSRPAVPRLQPQTDQIAADPPMPARQPENWPRERSIEHATLTPVFGTSCPPHGLSGVIRRYSYRKYSEGRAAHWLLLLLADRVDSTASTFGSFVTAHPDNPMTETGALAEFTHHGLRSRVGKKRTDVKHQWMDPLIVLAPWAARIGGAALILTALRRRRRPTGR